MARTAASLPSTLNATRQFLLDVAMKLFAEQGFSQTSVRQIVATAQVSKGALYHYFDSKDDMLFGIYQPLLKMQRERLDAVVESELPPTEKLTQAASDVVVTSLQNIDAMAVFFQSAHLLGPDKRKQMRAERRSYHEQFRSIIEQGQQAGTFRRDLDADLVVHLFFGSVHHLFTWYRAEGVIEPDQIARTIAVLTLEGLLTAPESGPATASLSEN